MLLWLLACRGPEPTDTAPTGALASAVADAGPDLAGLVGQTLILDGTASVGVGFLWDLGDGTRVEGQAVVEHAWDSPGSYAAVLQVTGQDGGRRSDAAVVTITRPAATTAPVPSSPILVDADRARLWWVAPEAGEVGSCDLALESCAWQALCEEPTMLGLADLDLAVACTGEDLVLVLDGETGQIKASVETGTGSAPAGLGGRDGALWVALQGKGELARIVEGELVERVAVGPDPRALVLGARGEVWLSRWRSPDEGAVLYRYHPDEGLSEHLLPRDEGIDSDTTNRGVPNLVEQLAMSPDGHSLLVPATQANILRGLWRDGQPLVQDKALRATASVLDLETGVESRKQLDQSGRLVSLLPSPTGDLLYGLDPGTGAVTVLDAQSLDIRGAVLGVGAGSRGLAIHPDGGILYVFAWLEREIRAYDLGTLPLAPPLLAAAPLQSREVLEADVLEGKRLFWSADPRITRSGYIACAHCHPDGREDGRTWDFTDRGEGLRNTTSLRGMGTGALTADPDLGLATGRLHWSGNFDEAQDFENDIRDHFGGTGLLSDEDWAARSETLGEPKAGRSVALDQLATYLHSLTTPPRSPHPEATEGEARFQEAGCGDCHRGASLTDSSRTADVRHDVGTIGPQSGGRLGGALDGLDTPALRGVWDTGPWLHDGSAPSLEAAIRAHDSAAGLSEENVLAIADWLRQL